MKLLALALSRLPSDCPFARTLHWGRVTLRIPPLCKLNPFYNQLMAGKFWALTYLESH
jgi:hypothetical protein